jgi:hypothetical protein
MLQELTLSPSSGCAEDGDRVRSRNIGKPANPDAAVCPRKFHWSVFVETDENKHGSTTHYKLDILNSNS